MDIGRAFTYVFEDEQWLTVILLGGLLLIPLALFPVLIPILLTGFVFATARNVAAGNPRPLPRWDRLGDLFGSGFYGWLIQLIYNLPLVIIGLLSFCVMFAVPWALAAGDEGAISGTLLVLLLFCVLPLFTLISLLLVPLVLAASVRFLQTGSLSAALRFGEIVAMVRRDLGLWMTLSLLQILCGLVGGLGSVAFGVGALFTTIYGQAVFGHLLGQAIVRLAQPGR